MQTHELVQGSPEWHQFRLEHYGASEAAAMLGLSKNVTRSELLRMKHTGLAKEFSDWVQEHILDKGHEVEALARPLAEGTLGRKLYPVTCSDDKLSASCDGLTMDESIAFEHKQYSKALFHSVLGKVVPEEHMPQCQQVLMVTGAQKLLFCVSDGTIDNFASIEVFPSEEWFERLRAGWAQFEKDLAEYVPPEITPEPVGRTPDTLPALRIEVTGMVTASNLAEFKAHALAVFEGINTELKTDQDFATAEKTVKWCGDVEDRLEAAKQHALSQTASIDELFRTIDSIKAEARAKRLELDRKVKAEKEARRLEIVREAGLQFSAHVEALECETTPIQLNVDRPDFSGCIKGMKNFTSMQDALDVALANGKIAAEAIAKDIRGKLAWFNDGDSNIWFMFPDMQQLIYKPLDDFKLIVTTRIEQHKAAEAAKLEAEREKIRAEEVAKIQREADARQAEELRRTEEELRAKQADAERQKAEAEAAGDSAKAAELATIAAGIKDAADWAKEDAAIKQDEAAIITAPTVHVPETKVSGISTRDNWKGRVTNKMELIKAVAEGRASEALLLVDESELNRRAKALKNELNVPGCEAYNAESATSGRIYCVHGRSFFKRGL